MNYKKPIRPDDLKTIRAIRGVRPIPIAYYQAVKDRQRRALLRGCITWAAVCLLVLTLCLMIWTQVNLGWFGGY